MLQIAGSIVFIFFGIFKKIQKNKNFKGQENSPSFSFFSECDIDWWNYFKIS